MDYSYFSVGTKLTRDILNNLKYSHVIYLNIKIGPAIKQQLKSVHSERHNTSTVEPNPHPMTLRSVSWKRHNNIAISSL